VADDYDLCRIYFGDWKRKRSEIERIAIDAAGDQKEGNK
jgi:hypothetical protein